VYQIYDSNETLEAALMVGHSGFDIVSTTTGFYGRQIKAGAYLPLDKSKLPNLANIDPAVLAIQAQADPGNRYAVPYLHAMNGFVYNVDEIKARMADAPTDSLAMIFDPKIVSKFADCGVTFLDSPVRADVRLDRVLDAARGQRRLPVDRLVERLLRRASARQRGQERRQAGLYGAQGGLEHHL
jgi:hypothetical protein